jgi:hypothetical protein
MTNSSGMDENHSAHQSGLIYQPQDSEQDCSPFAGSISANNNCRKREKKGKEILG